MQISTVLLEFGVKGSEQERVRDRSIVKGTVHHRHGMFGLHIRCTAAQVFAKQRKLGESHVADGPHGVCAGRIGLCDPDLAGNERRVEVVAHLVRPRFALTPLSSPGETVRRGQRLAFMSTTPLLDLRVPVVEWSPESVLMQGVNRANGQEVNAGTTVVFQPLWDAEE